MYSVPRMIIFDYGETIITEGEFNALKGNQVLLDMAVTKPEGITAQDVMELAAELNHDIGTVIHTVKRGEQLLEIPGVTFNRYLYEYFGIEFAQSMEEAERIFWDAAAPARPALHIDEVLDFLYQKGIRTAVISNMMNSTENLKKRINRLLPNNHFEFFISSGDHMFRKPHIRIFELAVKKAGLKPEQIWFCGDNLIYDIKGSFDAGMHPVLYLGAANTGGIGIIQTYSTAGNARTEGGQKTHNDNITGKEVPCLRITDWKELIEAIKPLIDESRRLVHIDKKDYDENGTISERIAARAIIKCGDKYVFIHGRKYNDYKLPGGGTERGEQLEDTLIREVREETGLIVKPETIKYVGWSDEIQKGMSEDIFRMVSYFFSCETEDEKTEADLDDYEDEYGYRLIYMTAKEAIRENEKSIMNANTPWITREIDSVRIIQQMKENGDI